MMKTINLPSSLTEIVAIAIIFINIFLIFKKLVIHFLKLQSHCHVSRPTFYYVSKSHVLP